LIGNVLVPITTSVPPGARLTLVPEMVMAGPPATRVWLLITNAPAEFAVIVWPATVITSGMPSLPVIGAVLDPTTTAVAPGARLIGVPETVMATPPGVSVWPSTITPLAGSAVMVWPPTVSTSGTLSPPIIGAVLDPTTTAVAPGARLIGVPEIVMAGLPGASVWPPTVISPVGFAVTVSPPMVRTVGMPLLPIIGTVLDPRMTAVALVARLITVPETVMAGLPGAIVWPPTIRPPTGSAVMVWPPTVMILGMPPFPGLGAGMPGRLEVACGRRVAG